MVLHGSPSPDRALAACILAIVGIPGLLACTGPRGGAAADSTRGAVTSASLPAASLPAVGVAAAGDSALAAAVDRGRAILTATRDSLPAHVGNDLRCTSCHLDEGRRERGLSWIGVYARFPQYRSREGAVLQLEDRVNGCLRRSMNGRPLPHDSPAMRDVVAYMAFLSRGVPVGPRGAGDGLPKLEATLPPDTTRGRDRYTATCAACHGVDGAGKVGPPLWGPRSFNVGAGMARLRTAAAFIRYNMPLDRPGTLSDRDAFDIAAWMLARPRPDFPGKERDWPNGDAPPDAAYPTLGARARQAAAPATERGTAATRGAVSGSAADSRNNRR
jgi:thiosulfate dehydrogenase